MQSKSQDVSQGVLGTCKKGRCGQKELLEWKTLIGIERGALYSRRIAYLLFLAGMVCLKVAEFLVMDTGRAARLALCGLGLTLTEGRGQSEA